MRDNNYLFSRVQRQTHAAIAFNQCCSGPLLLLGVIIMLFGVWSLPRTCYAEEPAPPANSDALIVSGPSTTPGDSKEQDSPAPAKSFDDPMMEATNFVSIGALAMISDYSQGVIMMGDFEKKIMKRLALFARLGRIEYWPDRTYDGYGEGGRGSGYELGLRLYPALTKWVSFYLGAGVGHWRLDEYWNTDRKILGETEGRRRSSVEHVQVHVGWKIRTGWNNTYVNPMVQWGSFNEAGTDLFYASLGIALGTSW